MKRALRGAWLDRMLGLLGPAVVRLHTRTLRVRLQGMEAVEERLCSGRPVVLAGWHQRFYMGIRPFRRLRPFIMISRSRDGERIARVAGALGWRPVRGSSSRGGARALVAMIRALSDGSVGAHIVDGPRGPARRVKPGLVALARRSGAAIVPVCLAARWRYVAPSWDRFHVPYPFSRVEIRIGPVVEVASSASPEEDAVLLEEIERMLERGHAELDRSLGVGRHVG